MSWDRHHSASEILAAEAEAALRASDRQRAEKLYLQASGEEAHAFDDLPSDKQKSRGITAVSAVALAYKSRQYRTAEQLACGYLREGLPAFAVLQLRDLLQSIWNAMAGEDARRNFIPGDVLVSLKGGTIVSGGAPLDLIMQKTEGINAVLVRTAEMLLKRPVRKKGRPEPEIQAMFRPWLFQALAGSYQFAIRVEEPVQLNLWKSANGPSIEQLTTMFLRVLNASANDPESELPSVVPEDGYREAFLRLSRNLAPTSDGKVFDRLEVRDASTPNGPVASFAAETRVQLNEALRKFGRDSTNEEGPIPSIVLCGSLRALHLDRDWLEIVSPESSEHTRIYEIGELLDDVIGPMVNHLVAVTTIRRGEKYVYRDIELKE